MSIILTYVIIVLLSIGTYYIYILTYKISVNISILAYFIKVRLLITNIKNTERIKLCITQYYNIM